MIKRLTFSRFSDVYKIVTRRNLRDQFLINYNKHLSDHMSDDDILQLIENRISEIRSNIKDINRTIYLHDDDAYFGDLRKHRKILEDAAINPELYDKLSEVDKMLCDNIIKDYKKDIRPSVQGTLPDDKRPFVYDGFSGITVQESDIVYVGYKYREKLLYVGFVWGPPDIYQNVPREIFNKMLIAENKGEFFDENINGKYPLLNKQHVSYPRYNR